MSLLTDDRLLWFLNRGSGVVVLVLLTASTALGVLATVRTTSSRWPRFVTQALHRNIALLSLVLLGVHAGTAIVDNYVDIDLIDAFVPFGSSYRALWGSLGTLALDLILLAVVTSLARHRFGLRRWRAVHLTTYLAWPLGLAHGIGMGTDQRAGWSVALTAICVGVVAGAMTLRLTGRGGARQTDAVPVRAPAPGTREARATENHRAQGRRSAGHDDSGRRRDRRSSRAGAR